MQTNITTIDAYIEQFPASIQTYLCAIRNTIKENAPEAKEKISWGMATFIIHGNLVHFAANKHHLGFYPGENGVAHFKEKLQAYKTSKGAIQFPYNQPIPHLLIGEIVRYRLKENIQAAELKQTLKKKI